VRRDRYGDREPKHYSLQRSFDVRRQGALLRSLVRNHVQRKPDMRRRRLLQRSLVLGERRQYVLSVRAASTKLRIAERTLMSSGRRCRGSWSVD
jgi:hypothetical protein